MHHDIDPLLVTALRGLRTEGRSPVWMLRFLDSRGLDQIEAMALFREAFGLDSADVSPIGGWFADGNGTLSDEDIDLQLGHALAIRDAEQESGEPDHLVVTRGPFTLDVARARRWCTITHEGTNRRAWLQCTQRQCGGEVSFRPVEDGAWACDEWSLVVIFPVQEGHPLVVTSREHGTLLDLII